MKQILAQATNRLDQYLITEKKKEFQKNIPDSESEDKHEDDTTTSESDDNTSKNNITVAERTSSNSKSSYPGDISDDGEDINENDPAHSKAAYQIISQLSQLLTEAQEQFLLPSRTSFPITYHGQQHFEPQLPKELLVDFKIKNSMLHVSAAFLKPSQPSGSTTGSSSGIPFSNSPSMRPKTEERKLIHSLQGNQYYEIVEQESMEYPAKKFTTIFCFLRDSAVICDELKDKLSVHL